MFEGSGKVRTMTKIFQFMLADEKVYDTEQRIVSKYQLSIVQLHSKSRKPALVLARAILMTYYHAALGYSKSTVGHYFNRNHSTVIHGISLIKNEPKVRAVYEENFGAIIFD